MIVKRTATGFVASLIFVLLGASALAEAQQASKMYRIGAMTITSTPPPEFQRFWDAFFEGLREFGYVVE
jgi:hypothetical protein